MRRLGVPSRAGGKGHSCKRVDASHMPSPQADTCLHRHSAHPPHGGRLQVDRLAQLEAQRGVPAQGIQPALAHQRQPLRVSVCAQSTRGGQVKVGAKQRYPRIACPGGRQRTNSRTHPSRPPATPPQYRPRSSAAPARAGKCRPAAGPAGGPSPAGGRGRRGVLGACREGPASWPDTRQLQCSTVGPASLCHSACTPLLCGWPARPS